jgi:hypothetical protein
VLFALGAATGEGAPLGKLQGQYLSRLHAAVARLTNTGGSPPPPPPPATPAAPSTLTAQVVSGTEIQLAWQDNSGNEESFRVEQSINGTFQQVQTAAVNATGARVSGLTAGTGYTFRVRAANAAGFSAYSNSASATTTPPPPPPPATPAAPSNLTVQALSTTEVMLTWQDNSSNEESFLIEKMGANGAFTQFNMRGANVTSFRVTGLAAGTLYTFRVRAKNAAGTSGYTNNASATTLVMGVPLAPSRLQSKVVSRTEVEISWLDNSADETDFRIEMMGPGGTFQEIRTVTANTVQARVASLIPGTTVFFRLRAKNASGFSPYSNTLSTGLPTATGR